MNVAVTRESQEVIVGALIKNSYLYATCKSELSDGYFSDPACKVIYKALSNYHRKYQTTPNLNELLMSIEDAYYPTAGVNLSDVKSVCERIHEYEEPDELFIKDKITDFIRKVRTSGALRNFIEQVKNNPNLESDEVVTNLAKSLDVNLSTTKVFSMNNFDDVKAARENTMGSSDQSRIVKSFIPSINANLMFGGWQPSTVNMVVAPPGCFVGDTRIMTIDGTSHTLQEIYDHQISPGVYGCSDRGDIRVGPSREVYLSHYTSDIVEIEIDDKDTIRCTEDHPFMTSGGRWVNASSLETGTEMMTVIRGIEELGGLVKQEYVHQPRSDTYWLTKELLAEFADKRLRPSEYKSQRGDVCRVTRVTKIHLDSAVPVYGIIDASPFGNFTVSLSEGRGVVTGNTGKSMFLINEGVCAAKQGYDVLHVFIGDMVEYDGFIRYVSCISGTPMNSIVMMSLEKQQEVVKFCDQQYDGIFNRLSILAYPSLAVNVETLTEDIAKFEKQLNKDFGVIIIDYPDNMIQDGKSLYEDGGTLYSSLEKLARMSQAVVLTASQPQKFYWNHEIIPLEAASESSKKQMAVDVMITMNTSSRGAPFGSMHLAKARKGNVGKVFRFKTEYTNCGIEEIDESTYNAMKSAYGLKN